MASLISIKPPTLSIHRTKSVSLPSIRCNSISTTHKKVKANGGLHTLACSTSPYPYIGRVGSQRREGNISLLSFGINTGDVADDAKNDPSQVLSAMLPFVVAATAVAALSKPSTFTWWVLLLLRLLL